MNFQTKPVLTPLRVLIVNPLTPAGQMIIVKILSGSVFGEDQYINLILLVFSNERPSAEILRLELIGCGFCCYNEIIISSDLPSISDADVFCFLSNLADPNTLSFERSETDDQFDALYLTIKVASNLCVKERTEEVSSKTKPEVRNALKTIIMADGLAAMDILKSLSKDLPSDIFFCPSPIPDVAKSVLAEFLKVKCNAINDLLVWAANDSVFHVEVENPLIIQDKVFNASKCEWDSVSKDTFKTFDYDHTQFSPSWLKKEYIHKISSITKKNPYGCIYRASSVSNALKSVWISRNAKSGKKYYCSLGVISDGSLETIKGLPYVLPLVFSGDLWSVNSRYGKTSHVRNEIKRINKAVKEHHSVLMPFCKKFLKENVIDQSFIPVPESSTEYSIESSKTSL